MCVAGGACVAGLSLSVINGWLTLISLLLSVSAGVHYWLKQRKPNEGGHDDAE